MVVRIYFDACCLSRLIILTFEVDETVVCRAQRFYRIFDALHIAAAEAAGVDVMLSTHDRLIKRAARGLGANGLVRFLRLNRSGPGDYTRDRDERQKDLRLDQILESIRKNRPHYLFEILPRRTDSMYFEVENVRMIQERIGVQVNPSAVTFRPRPAN